MNNKPMGLCRALVRFFVRSLTGRVSDRDLPRGAGMPSMILLMLALYTATLMVGAAVGFATHEMTLFMIAGTAFLFATLDSRWMIAALPPACAAYLAILAGASVDATCVYLLLVELSYLFRFQKSIYLKGKK